MKHAISSIFNAVRGTGASAAVVDQHARSSSMTVLTFTQLRHIVGGDDATVDGLPKGGWKTTSTAA